jgi:hypothetical protein
MISASYVPFNKKIIIKYKYKFNANKNCFMLQITLINGKNLDTPIFVCED